MSLILRFVSSGKEGIIKRKHPYSPSGKTVLNCLLLLLMALSFWSVRSSALSHSTASVIFSKDDVAVASDVDLADQPMTSITPTQLSGVPLELIEMMDDSSNDDNTDIDPIELAHHFSFEVPLHLVSSDNLLLHLSESAQARPAADLFMLHHSWRSFLV